MQPDGAATPGTVVLRENPAAALLDAIPMTKEKMIVA